MQRLIERWRNGGWPKWLDWIELTGLRGWTGQRVDFRFPIIAVVGENGSGKSTLLQAIASVFRAPPGEEPYYASQFFPSTAWESVQGVTIQYSVREGQNAPSVGSVRKPSKRWLGNPRRRVRSVQYIDLRRTQPIAVRTGYARLTKAGVAEAEVQDFEASRLGRLSAILGRTYARARHSRTTIDDHRWVPVTTAGGAEYSGFHQGAGETTVVDLLRRDIPATAIVLIDEIETSLHPRAQRRLMRDLAALARERQLQVILTTHSPYILEELPPEGRLQLLTSTGVPKEVVVGVSAEFAMTQMDDERHPELDLYVEDRVAAILITEMLAKYRPDAVRRLIALPFGSADLGKALGRMVDNNRFPRPTLVILDGDQDESDGTLRLPGNEAPERVVFAVLAQQGWPNLAQKLSRSHADLVDAATHAMTLADHHEWLRYVGNAILLGSEELWRGMVAIWVHRFTQEVDFGPILEAIDDSLAG